MPLRGSGTYEKAGRAFARPACAAERFRRGRRGQKMAYHNEKAESFYRSLKGRRVAFCGIGGSNLPLIRSFAEKGARVTARDKRSREQLGGLAAELEALGVSLVLGEGYLGDLTEEIVFRTPGMRFTQPELEVARARGAAVTSEMEVFFDLCPCPIWAVTGSDGKTTTTTVISELLKAAGKRVHLGGNIGRPLLPVIDEISPEDAAVVELSSFQLISMRHSPETAVVTNLSPNHLDIHKDMQEYIDAKKNIFLHQNAFGRAVFNADNEITASFAPEARGDVLLFSRKKPCARGVWVSPEGWITVSDNGQSTPVLPVSEIRIPGLHNVENYLAAIAAVWGSVPAEAIRAVARTFGGVAHRNELVRERRGVRWYNDSIGTSPTRTMRGTLSLYDEKIILIAGGYDKHLSYDELGAMIPEKVKLLVLLGATADKIEAATRAAASYREGCPDIRRVGSMEEAVALCDSLARDGDIVTLSPASASFDLYRNFEERGDHFKRLVLELPE